MNSYAKQVADDKLKIVEEVCASSYITTEFVHHLLLSPWINYNNVLLPLPFFLTIFKPNNIPEYLSCVHDISNVLYVPNSLYKEWNPNPNDMMSFLMY